MPAVTRELAIIYGSLTLGGTSSTYLLTGTYSVRHGYGQLTVECSVVVVAATQAAFRTAYIALEDGIRLPRQDLTITLGGGSQTFTMAANTGLNQEGVCSRSEAGSTFDTGMSRLYDISITCELPADNSGDNGLATKSIDVVTDAADRALVTLNGSYTALAGNSARAQYDAQIAALISSTMTALSITNYETIQTDVAEDYANKIVSFRLAVQEILYPETGAATNDSRLKNVRLTITRQQSNQGNATTNVEVPIELSVGYGCDVDSAVTTDLETLWDTVIYPYMVDKAREVTEATTIAVISKNPQYNRSGNGIEATIGVIAYSAGALISHQISTVDDENYAIKLIPVWDGNPSAKIIQTGEANIVKTVREETVRFQRGIGAGGAGLGGGGFSLFGGAALQLGAGAFGAFGGGALSLNIQMPQQQGPAAAAGEAGDGTPAGVRPANRGIGQFIEVKRTYETTPIVQGLPPYQVRLERSLSVVYSVWVVKPQTGWIPPKPTDGEGEGISSKRLGG